jgi:hypothetical protein
MATPIYPPTITTNILVNTRTAAKIVYLPAVSTIGAGRLIFVKDICGNAANSSIYLSTTGLDSFEYKFRPSTLYALMSTNFQSVLLASDGILNWMILQNYNANAITRATFSFTYFSNPIFQLGTVPTGNVYSNSAGTTLAVPTGTVQLWKDTNNTYNFGLGTAPTYQTIGSVNAVYFVPNQFLSGSGSAVNNLAIYTLETTVRLGSTTGVFFSKQRNGINSYVIFRYSSGQIIYQPQNGGTGVSSTAGVLTTNTWYYIVLTYDGTAVRLYINGTLNNSTTGTGGAIPNDTNPTCSLGAWTGDGNTFSTLYMAEFNAYSSAATASDITNSYNSRKSYFGLA